MCYSAEIIAEYRLYVRMSGADISLEEFYALYWARLKDRSIKIPKAIDTWFAEAQGGRTAEISGRAVCRASAVGLLEQAMQASAAPYSSPGSSLNAAYPAMPYRRIRKGITMSLRVFAACLVAAPLALPLAAHSKGCLKGAAVGGVAGHVAGKHAIAGAAAGCAIEHHRETKAQKASAAASANQSSGK